MNRIKNLYWTVFFSAYWVAKDLNKRNDPPWSACGILEIMMFNLFCGIIFFIFAIDDEKRPLYNVLIILAAITSLVINETAKPKHKKLIKSYDYLSKPESKKLRFKIAFGAFLSGLAVMLIGALINNPTVQSFFRSLFM